MLLLSVLYLRPQLLIQRPYIRAPPAALKASWRTDRPLQSRVYLVLHYIASWLRLVVPHSKPNTYVKTLPLSSVHAGSVFATQDGGLATVAKKKLRHCIRSILCADYWLQLVLQNGKGIACGNNELVPTHTTLC